ncbi:MAG: hypothetical protein AAF600_09655 [Bacteroidota bacterium]
MDKIIPLIFVILSLEVTSQDQLRVIKVNERIALKIPLFFSQMPEGERINKFVSSRTPIAMFTSEDREADLGINTNMMRWVEGGENKLKSLYKGTFETLFDKVEYIQDTVKEINGRKFIVFEFVSSVKDENAFSGTTSTRNYSYIQYTSYNDQILLFNFGCKPKRMGKWQPIVKEIMESIKLKGN